MTNKIIHRMLSTVLLIPMPAPFSGGKEKEQARPVAPPEVEVVAVEQRDAPIYRERVGTLEREVNTTIPANL